MYGHPIARQMEEWWRTHGARHDSQDWQDYITDLRALLSAKFDELTEEHSNTDDAGVRRFGMSKAGGCTRAATLKLLGYEPEPFSGSSLATFHIGHLLESMAIATLKRVGLDIPDTQPVVRLDPFMQSASDGIIRNFRAPTGQVWDLGDEDTHNAIRVERDQDVILSVKSTGYKKSGNTRGKWVRQGFPALPFEGIKRVNAGAWAQAQAEMHGSGIHNTLVVVVAKDIVKAMEKDPYLMGDTGNGSLTFYAELVPYDPEFCEEQFAIWEAAWESAQLGRAGRPMYFNPNTTRYHRLPNMGDQSGWGGPNQDATGTFNPCFGCDQAVACTTELAKEYRRGSS